MTELRATQTLAAPTTAAHRLPWSLAWLVLGAFAIGTESFMIAGLLQLLAADLKVSAARAGQLVLLFALSYAIGSPLMAALFARVERRRLLFMGLAAFAAIALAGSLAQSFAQLAAVRIALGLTAGMFLPSASAVAASLTAPSLRGRALAVVTGGGTVAVALGVPLGAWIAGWGGWRAAYLLVAVLAALGALGLANGLPKQLRREAPAERSPALAAARQPGLLPALLITVLWATGGFSFYTYISVFLAQTLGFGAEGIGAVLCAIGVAAAVGTAAGGWATDRFDADSVARAFALMLVLILGSLSLAAQALSRSAAVPVIVMLAALWGFAGWGFGPAQAMRLIRLAPAQAPMTLSLNASAIYLGIACGSALGGLAIDAIGIGALGWVGAACQFAALMLLTMNWMATGTGTGRGKASP